MDKHPTYDKPSKVKAKEGKVEVRGPDDVDVEMTPEAAVETSNRLLEGAMIARGKERMKDFRHKPD